MVSDIRVPAGPADQTRGMQPIPPTPAPSKVRPSAIWIAVAIFLLVAGPAGCGVFLVTKAVGVVQGLDEFGRYTLPVDSDTVVFDQAVDDGQISVDLGPTGGRYRIGEISLVAPDGSEVALERMNSNATITYSFGSERATLVDIFHFKIDVPGSYTLRATTLDGNEADSLWIGRHGISAAATGIGVAAILGLVVGFGGLILLIVVIMRRKNAKRAIATPGPYGSYPPPPDAFPVPPSAPPAPPSVPTPPGWGDPPPPS